ncbi:MAG: segregation/condensation protein A [Actinobacteria bacterium]|nr:segregation/condensation protein A [Actinomycetota bacterium]
MAYEVKTDVFQGPIDLLLQLITRQRVDIYEVSLAEITDEFLAATRRMETLDLESATGFLVVAATLLELKSLRLLPSRAEDPSEGRLLEERDLLLARLVECATYREAGSWVNAGLASGGRFFARTAGLEPQFFDLAPDLLVRISLDDIAGRAGLALAPKPDPQIDTTHVNPVTASVKDAIVELCGRLEASPRVSFDELCGRITERIEVVVRFLALLELFKAGAVDLGQADRFGDIVATWTGEVDVHEVVAEAEEYTVELPEPAGQRQSVVSTTGQNDVRS